MRKIDNFLFGLRKEKNISISVDNGQLSISGPKQFLTPEMVEELKARKQDILTYFESQKEYQLITVPLAAEKDRYRLSSAQQRVYFEKELNDQSIAYNLPVIIRLKGNLDIEKIKLTFSKIVQRHQILRTSFKAIAGELFQVIHPEMDCTITFSKTNSPVKDVVEGFIRPFDLHQAPLFRIGVFELAAEDHLLLFDMHHIITDGVSSSLLISEFADLYNDKELPLPDLQYKDYAEWQQSAAYNDIIAHQKAFWENEFAEAPVPLELPLDRVRSLYKKPAAGSVELEIETQQAKALKELARDMGTTQYAILLAAYYMLLSKLSGQEDIVIGTVTTGRFNQQVASLLGMFVNTVPLRNFPRGELSFREFLDAVKYNLALCFDNQLYQFETLVSDLNIKRETNRNPLFDVFFTYHNYDRSGLEIPGLLLEPVNEGIIKTVFDIELTAYEFDDRIALSFIHNAHLFKRETMERYADYFNKIVSQVIANPDIQLADVNILGASEIEKLVFGFNDTTVDYPANKTVMALFEEQAAKTPGHVAVRYREHTITYKELDEKSGRVANYLRQKWGVKNGDMVGLLLEREEGLMPSIYGIIRSGAVYVPLSPGYPPARLNAIIADAGLKTIITRRRYMDALSIEGETALLDLDVLQNEIDVQPAVLLNAGPGPRDLAYVIYTSGSTGKPKGVMIEHHSIVNRLVWMQKRYGLTENDVLLQKTSLVFDVSIWELFWWSFTGASICVLQPEAEKDPEEMIREIKRNAVTTIHFVPSMLSAFLDTVERQPENHLSSLRQVFASGEALGSDQANRFSKTLYDACGTRLINLYGPTEATVDVSFYECDLTQRTSVIPIGRPIDNTRLYIVDRNKRLVPMGVAGELCIAGAGLARGYLNNPGLTADKFVTASWNQEERLYRTGDLACWLPNGNIKFLGRIDDQVKIRGYRIELEEIAFQLMCYPGIRQAAVNVKNGKFLMAHYVSSQPIDNGALRDHLLQSLPEYMVPQHYFHLSEMPLTSNGKLNRKKLSEAEIEIQSAYTPPENDLQRKLANIWAEVLKIERVGIKDDYFSLGGDSIKSIKLIYEINEQMGCNLKLADIYTHKTIESLSVLVAHSSDSSDTAYAEAQLRLKEFQQSYKEQNGFSAEYEAVYPMSGIEIGMVYYTMLMRDNEQHFDNILYHEQNPYAIHYLDFRFDIFMKALHLMIDKHSTLRKIYDTNNFAHIVLKKIDPEVNYIDLTSYSKEEQEAYWKEKINSERLKASGYAREVLWRMNILKLADDFHYLIFDMHHSVFDGWSLHAFLTELNNTYLNLRENADYRPAKLEADYADHILGEMVDVNDASSIAFWKTELNNYNRFYFPRINDEHRFITKYFQMDPALKTELKATAAKFDTTIKDLCFAAFAYTMGMLSHNKDFVIGRTTNNRPAVRDGDKILGCFLNQVGFPVSIPDEGTWADFIRSIADKTKQMKAYERMPFYKLLEIINEPTQKGINPVFDLAFNYIDFWIVGEMIKTTDVTQKRFDFWHDGNDVNQNTLFDFHVKTTLNTFLVVMEYSTTIMNDQLTNRIFEYFRKVLDLFIHHANDPLNSDAVLPEREKSFLLSVNNKQAAAYPAEETLVTLFEQQVRKAPQAVALVFEDQPFTYEELNRRSNQLARLLIAKGCCSNVIVGLLTERGPWTIIAMLAILKAGGAYLPIDVEYPMERIQFQLNDSGIELLITESPYAGMVDENRIQCIFTDQVQLDNEDPSNLNLPISSRDLCYVIYTSGTTGKPKGVMIEHRNVVRLLFSQGFQFEFSAADVWTMFHNHTFDVSVWEMYGAFLYGGKLILIPRKKAQDPRSFLEDLQKHHVTILCQTPTAFYNLLNEEYSGSSGSLALRYVIFAGEALTPSKLKNWRARYPHIKLINMYGITETTVHVTYMEITEHEINNNIGSIGGPIPTISIYLLDKYRRLVPEGVQGEMYVGGAGVGRGYLNREELTNERFIADPYNPAERLYKSGDEARLLGNGQIEYLGRLDKQVKIRGYRIELGEIEHQLMSYEHVKDVVLTCYDTGDDKKLVAFLLPKENTTLNIFNIKKYLKAKLPDYMVPALIRKIDKIPLTSNGKVDEKALLRSIDKSDSEKAVVTKPRTDIEQYLAALWSDVLLVSEISVDDNFFDLGGHSLLVLKANSKVNSQYSVDLPLHMYFDRTLERIAQEIEIKLNKDLQPAPIQ